MLCVRVNAWDTKWTYGDVIEVVGGAGERLDEIMLPKVQSAAEVVALDLLLTQVEENAGLPIGTHRDRGPDRDRPRAHQRRRHLRGVAAARDDHLRPGRLRRLDGDARADRRRAGPRVPGRPLPLRLLPDPDGRPGQRPAGDRRAVPPRARFGQARATSRCGPGSSATTGSGPSPPTRQPCSTRCTRRPRSSSTGLTTSSTPTARRPRRNARAR